MLQASRTMISVHQCCCVVTNKALSLVEERLHLIIAVALDLKDAYSAFRSFVPGDRRSLLLSIFTFGSCNGCCVSVFASKATPNLTCVVSSSQSFSVVVCSANGGFGMSKGALLCLGSSFAGGSHVTHTSVGGAILGSHLPQQPTPTTSLSPSFRPSAVEAYVMPSSEKHLCQPLAGLMVAASSQLRQLFPCSTAAS